MDRFFKKTIKNLLFIALVVTMFSATQNASAQISTEEIIKAAKAGDAEAQTNLAEMYHNGAQGVKQSHERAFHWHKLAAEQGQARSQYSLGSFYYSGLGVAQSYKKSFHWHKLAAEQGYPESQYHLALFYSNGSGVESNIDEAIEWMEKAVEKNVPGSQRALSRFYKKKESEKVAQSIITGDEAKLAEAAERGDASAISALNSMYGYAAGSSQRKNSFIKILKAAEAGVAQAQYRLGTMYDLGEQGVKQSYEKASEWFQKAAYQGDPEAQTRLAEMYYLGEQGVKQDYEKAFQLYKRAAEKGHAVAKKNLNFMLNAGLGVEQNKKNTKLDSIKDQIRSKTGCGKAFK